PGRHLGTDLRVLLKERNLPLVDTKRHEVAVIAPVEKFLAWGFLDAAFEERHQVHPVEMDLEALAVERRALRHLLNQVRIARRRGEGGDKVLVRANVVDDGSGLDHAGPTDQAGHAEAALPIGGFLALEWRRAAIGPSEYLRAVVGGVDDDGVVGDAE